MGNCLLVLLSGFYALPISTHKLHESHTLTSALVLLFLLVDYNFTKSLLRQL